MPIFLFKATDKSGKTLISEVEAASEDEARTTINGKGLEVVAIKERPAKRKQAGERERGKEKKKKRVLTIGGVNRRQLTQFTMQLATLIDAGVPLPRSLAILEDQTKPGVLKNHLMDVSEDVETGSSLSDALGKHSKVFDSLYVNMVRAGQIGGVLDQVLARLAEFMEKSQKLRRKVIGASVYPAVVACVAVTILSLIMIFVVPKFDKLFKDQGITKPAMTEVLLGTSDTIYRHWYLLPAIPILLIVIFRLLDRTRGGKIFIDQVKLKMPVIGNIMRKATIARFARTLGTLDASGVDILDALRICRDAINNQVLARAINNVHDAIREGESIADPLRESGLFTELVVNMVAVGEETGQLSKMLLKVADVYDEEVDSAVAAMTALLEPILILFMGGAVAFIVISLFLPLLAVLEAAQKTTRTGG